MIDPSRFFFFSQSTNFMIKETNIKTTSGVAWWKPRWAVKSDTLVQNPLTMLVANLSNKKKEDIYVEALELQKTIVKPQFEIKAANLGENETLNCSMNLN